MKNMKKILLLAFVISLLGNTANAQFYFRAGDGYAFPQAGGTKSEIGFYNGSVINTSYPGIGSSSYNIAFTVKEASFSAGYQSYIGLGYMLNPHIGLQLDANIGISNRKFIFNDGAAITANAAVGYTQQANH